MAALQPSFMAHPAGGGTALSRSAWRLMHTLICLDQKCNPAPAGPLNLIWGFETASKLFFAVGALYEKSRKYERPRS
jgi:hypothetical protein